MNPEYLVYAVLLLALIFFVYDRWRYDLVALVALLALTIPGIVPVADAFAGFGHPAVITVAAVLIINRALLNSGLVDLLARQLSRVGNRLSVQLGALSGFCAFCSALTNNVAAVALLMPVTVQLARKAKRPPSQYLMPLAYSSLLGGMITLVGTPPNIIIATYRAQVAGASFGFFDFTPVGLGIAAAGIAYMALIGWRLLPVRKGQASREEMFQITDYFTEVRLTDECNINDRTFGDLGELLGENILVAGVVRDERRILLPSAATMLRRGDILIVQADSETLNAFVAATGCELAESKDLGEQALRSDEVALVEAVVRPGSPMVDQTVRRLDLRRRHGVNLLAVARHGERMLGRLAGIRFRAGDVMLLQGPPDAIQEMLTTLGSLPLAERRLRIGYPKRILQAVTIFGTAIAAVSLNLIPIEIAMVTAAVALVLVGLVSVREMYETIEWPVIVLLGAMIPVATALENTGGADRIADLMLRLAGDSAGVIALVVVLLGAMILTPLVNNAAAAVLMAPIAISVANGLGASPDTFLMAAAVGVSCDFLTPIGHQSNTLVMGPGGYKFADYWKMGLPIELIVIVVGIPLLLFFWPL
jgi:di/tricarboxylate transporter